MNFLAASPNVMPPPPPRTRNPPAYNMAAHMARMQKLGRAHSHEGVTSYYTDTEDGKLKFQKNRILKKPS